MDKFEKGYRIAKLSIVLVIGIAFVGSVLYFGNKIISKMDEYNSVSHIASEVTKFSEDVADVEEHDAVITQENVPYPVYVDYGEVILGTASQECDLRIMTRSVQVSDEISKDGLFGWDVVFGQTQGVVYHANVDYFVDLGELDIDDILVNEREHTIRITVPYPTHEVNLVPEEYEFFDSSNGLLRFGEMQITPEIQTQLESNARTRIEANISEDDASWTIVEDYARLSIENLFQTSVNAQTNENLEASEDNAQFVYYDVIVEFE